MPQRGFDLEPRVAALRRLPWVSVANPGLPRSAATLGCKPEPLRGIDPPCWGKASQSAPSYEDE